MGIVTVLRALSHRRRAVLVVGVLSLLLGALVLFQLPSLKPRQYTVGISNVNILLDTPDSQVVEVAPRGSDTIGIRATLLASLMVNGVVKTYIARVAGINPTELAGTSEVATSPTQTGPTNPHDPQISTQIVTDANGSDLPIIEVTVRSNDAAAAARLAQASVTGLHDYLASKAAVERIPDADRLQVDGLGVPIGTTVKSGPGITIAMGVMLLFFFLGCATILGLAALRRNWRVVLAAEAAGTVPGEDRDEPGDGRRPEELPAMPIAAAPSLAAPAPTAPIAAAGNLPAPSLPAVSAVPFEPIGPAALSTAPANGWRHEETAPAPPRVVQQHPAPSSEESPVTLRDLVARSDRVVRRRSRRARWG